MYALNSYSDLIFPPPGLFLCIDSQFFPMILNTFPPPLGSSVQDLHMYDLLSGDISKLPLPEQKQ